MEVGEEWKDQFEPGMKFAQQPALNYKGSLASPGYSYEYFGGACTYCIIPHEVMELGCLMPYEGDSFFEASLGEPMSCIIGGYHGNYHTNKRDHNLSVGTKEGGDIIILGGCGPMGLGAVSYGIQMDNRPKRIVVTDIDDAKIARAREVIPETKAMENGVELLYVNTAKMDDPVAELKAITGGNNDDLVEANELAAKGRIEPAVMVTHVGGIDSIAETTLNLPNIPGGKKLSYTQFEMPMTAIEDFGKLGKTDPLFKKLDEICRANRGLWCAEAEKTLFEHFGVTY